MGLLRAFPLRIYLAQRIRARYGLKRRARPGPELIFFRPPRRAPGVRLLLKAYLRWHLVFREESPRRLPRGGLLRERLRKEPGFLREKTFRERSLLRERSQKTLIFRHAERETFFEGKSEREYLREGPGEVLREERKGPERLTVREWLREEALRLREGPSSGPGDLPGGWEKVFQKMRILAGTEGPARFPEFILFRKVGLSSFFSEKEVLPKIFPGGLKEMVFLREVERRIPREFRKEGSPRPSPGEIPRRASSHPPAGEPLLIYRREPAPSPEERTLIEREREVISREETREMTSVSLIREGQGHTLSQREIRRLAEALFEPLLERWRRELERRGYLHAFRP